MVYNVGDVCVRMLTVRSPCGEDRERHTGHAGADLHRVDRHGLDAFDREHHTSPVRAAQAQKALHASCNAARFRLSHNFGLSHNSELCGIALT